jgi:hypothetical protein
MHLSAVQNDARATAPAENRKLNHIPSSQHAIATAMAEKTPPNPGPSGLVPEFELSKGNIKLNSAYKVAEVLPAPMCEEKNPNCAPSRDEIPERNAFSQRTNAPAPSGTNFDAPSQMETFYHALSESEWSDRELAPEMASEKAEAPALFHDIYPTPDTIVADMREFAKAMAPCKFTKIENAATRLVAKFKKALVCPKCEVLHGHTFQGSPGNQYGGTVPHNKCRSSVPQLLMMLPHEIISLVAKVHKDFSRKDATQFSSWLASSKAIQKDAVLKRLNQELAMEVEVLSTQDNDIEETEMGEIREQEVEGTSYSDAEFKSTVIAELALLRKMLNALEEENRALRAENALLKKITPAVKAPVLPSSTTSLDVPASSYAEVAKIHVPRLSFMTKRNRQEVGAAPSPNSPKSKPIIDLSAFSTDTVVPERKDGDSKLVFAYFKGLVRRPQSEYRALFNQIGFGGHKARDIMFLSKDFVQVLTYENCVEELAEKLNKAVPTARLVRDADPTDPSNYEEHGKLSKEFLHAQYFTVMEGSVARMKKLAVERPVLTRTLHFLEKVVSSRNTKYEKPARKPKVFLMNSFMALSDMKAEHQEMKEPEECVSQELAQAPMEISQ